MENNPSQTSPAQSAEMNEGNEGSTRPEDIIALIPEDTDPSFCPNLRRHFGRLGRGGHQQLRMSSPLNPGERTSYAAAPRRAPYSVRRLRPSTTPPVTVSPAPARPTRDMVMRADTMRRVAMIRALRRFIRGRESDSSEADAAGDSAAT